MQNSFKSDSVLINVIKESNKAVDQPAIYKRVVDTFGNLLVFYSHDEFMEFVGTRERVDNNW